MKHPGQDHRHRDWRRSGDGAIDLGLWADTPGTHGSLLRNPFPFIMKLDDFLGRIRVKALKALARDPSLPSNRRQAVLDALRDLPETPEEALEASVEKP